MKSKLFVNVLAVQKEGGSDYLILSGVPLIQVSSSLADDLGYQVSVLAGKNMPCCVGLDWDDEAQNLSYTAFRMVHAGKAEPLSYNVASGLAAKMIVETIQKFNETGLRHNEVVVHRKGD